MKAVRDARMADFLKALNWASVSAQLTHWTPMDSRVKLQWVDYIPGKHLE